MIQFNLLPDVKKEYIKAKRTKRLIFSISTISAISAIVLVVFLFSIVQFVQKKNISDLTKDIDAGISDLQSVENLSEILTIQRQLESIPGLHEQKPETSRLFTYLTQLTPADITISTLQISFENSTIVIEGRAPSLASVNRYTDTVKFAKFTQKGIATNDSSEENNQTEAQLAFSEVVTELSRNEELASYKISAVFDPLLFENSKIVTLVIPDTVTTRSTQGKPVLSESDDNPLFNSNGSGGVN